MVNMGNNSLLPSETRDLLSLPRVYNGTIDIGAYELQENPTTDKTFYVKQNAAPTGSCKIIPENTVLNNQIFVANG